MMTNSRPVLLQSDLEVAAAADEQQRNAAEAALQQIGRLLSDADGALSHLESEDVLGSAIVRGCAELADAIGHLANQIDQQTPEERRALAQACIDDAQSTLLLEEEGAMPSSMTACQKSQELANLTPDQVEAAIHAAGDLLRDVEFTLRAIDRDEAEELADVALTVAHLFIASLQSLHATITPEDLTSQRSLQPSSKIEMIDEEPDDFEPANKYAAKRSPTSKSGLRMDRVRVLWPPLGPAVAEACDWGTKTAQHKPLLAVALGLALWPAAVVTTMIGAPLVLADGLIQDVYNNFQDAPLITGMERTAAQLYHTGRLSLLTGKLVGRQTLRVASRQVERHGGVEKIVGDLAHLAVDRVTHPVETIGMAWNGMAWGLAKAKEAWDNLNDDESNATTQRLQQ